MGLFRVFLVWISFRLGLLVCAALSDDCRTIHFQPETKDKFLNNHVIRSMKVQSQITCELRCYHEPNCVSYNYGPVDSDMPSCDLNNRTHLRVSSSKFVTKQGYTYRHVLNSCQSSPCPLTCQVGFTTKGYRCVCELDFIPGIGSIVGSCYKLFPEPETWNNAAAKCRRALEQNW
ncbi:uncharacterized protein LOC144658357 [Oculina patagonica]